MAETANHSTAAIWLHGVTHYKAVLFGLELKARHFASVPICGYTL